MRRGFRKRVIEDVPPVTPRIVQYRIERMYCTKCRKFHEPDVDIALPGATLSIRAMLIVAFFKTGMRMSIEDVSMTMREIFDLSISEGEVPNILSQLSESIGPEYDKLLEQIRDAPSRHMDTTSWRVNGENHDLWTFVTKSEAIFRITKSNNHEVPLAVLGDHKGTDVHDRHSAFETLAKKTGNDQQYCWSHIICDAK
ncbi:transposase, unclassified family protein, partial [mine drainage metagenome]